MINNKVLVDRESIEEDRIYRDVFKRNSEAARAINNTLLRCADSPKMITVFVRSDVRKYGEDRIKFALVNLIRKQLAKNESFLSESSIKFALENQGFIPTKLFSLFYYTSYSMPESLNWYVDEFIIYNKI